MKTAKKAKSKSLPEPKRSQFHVREGVEITSDSYVFEGSRAVTQYIVPSLSATEERNMGTRSQR